MENPSWIMKKLLFVLLFSFPLLAKETICLNMIIKDEKAVIERCLNSVKGVIDYWVIVDTGSSDGTQEIVKKTMKGIPGELHERPWVNFGHNRNEALTLAQGKGDYVLFIDADEQLQVEAGFIMPELCHECYLGQMIDDENGITFSRILLLRNKPVYEWKGAIHEGIYPPPRPERFIKGLSVLIETSASNRSQDPDKYKKDAAILEKEIERDPNNSRSYYYLAQSYFNIKDFEKSLMYYQKRTEFDDAEISERFWSLFMVGFLQDHLQYPSDQIIESYTRAHQFRKIRTEPLICLANHYLQKGDVQKSYETTLKGVDLEMPRGELGYLDDEAYTYKMKLFHANNAMALQKFDEAIHYYRYLQENNLLPESLRAEVAQRLEQCYAKKKEVPLSAAVYVEEQPPQWRTWFEHHKKMGFSHFYVYGKQCDKGLQPYVASGNATFIRWQGDKEGAYQDAVNRASNIHTWLALLSQDEQLPLVQSINSILDKYRLEVPAVLIQGIPIVQPLAVFRVTPEKIEYINNNQPCPISNNVLF